MVNYLSFKNAIIYHQEMDFPEENEKSRPVGRPSVWPDELGLTVKRTVNYPAAIWALLRELPVKRLLARLATDPKAKAEILGPYSDP